MRAILAPNPSAMTGAGTNSYLIGSKEIAVVDPGPDCEEHVGAIVDALTPGERIGLILVTHGHADHLGAVAALKAICGAPVVGHRDLPGVDRPLADGQSFDLGELTVAALATPGHADDHLCFWLPADRCLFAGDLVGGGGGSVVLAERRGALSEYLASLRRVAALGAHLLLPGHGPPVEDGAARALEQIAHRERRGAAIEAALADEPLSLSAIVDRVYADTPPPLRTMAERNARQHLWLLEERGRVRQTDARWRLV